MTILVPSYHKEGRKISVEMYNRPEVYFMIRPSQLDWYKENFPNANYLDLVPDKTPVGLIGIAVARQKILEWWRKNHGDEEWCFVPDDDIKSYFCNDTPQGKKYEVTIDKAFEILKSYADEDTTIIGPTNCDLNIFHNPLNVKINSGEAPEGCSIISYKIAGNYSITEETFENQLIAGLQIVAGKNFKVINRILFKRYTGKNTSVCFQNHLNNIYTKTKELSENTIKYFPDLVTLKDTINGSSVRVNFKKQKIPPKIGLLLKKS
jgi:hypothetical protein